MKTAQHVASSSVLDKTLHSPVFKVSFYNIFFTVKKVGIRIEKWEDTIRVSCDSGKQCTNSPCVLWAGFVERALISSWNKLYICDQQLFPLLWNPKNVKICILKNCVSQNTDALLWTEPCNGLSRNLERILYLNGFFYCGTFLNYCGNLILNKTLICATSSSPAPEFLLSSDCNLKCAPIQNLSYASGRGNSLKCPHLNNILCPRLIRRDPDHKYIIHFNSRGVPAP